MWLNPMKAEESTTICVKMREMRENRARETAGVGARSEVGGNWTVVNLKRRNGRGKGRIGDHVHGNHWTMKGQGASVHRGWNINRMKVGWCHIISLTSLLTWTVSLWHLFAKWGRVVDVFVPKKKNKEGKLFGFARFKDVWYPQELERRLDQIWVGSFKLRVNSMRFSRDKGREDRLVRQDNGHANAGVAQSKGFMNGRLVGGKSFSDVVKGKTKKQRWIKKKVAS